MPPLVPRSATHPPTHPRRLRIPPQFFGGPGPAPPKPSSPQEVRDRSAVARSGLLRANSGFIPDAGFRQRKAYFAAKVGGQLGWVGLGLGRGPATQKAAAPPFTGRLACLPLATSGKRFGSSKRDLDAALPQGWQKGARRHLTRAPCPPARRTRGCSSRRWSPRTCTSR